ncbi:unnamed protein product, partial [Ectocarpus sp. 12 AP-2014]
VSRSETLVFFDLCFRLSPSSSLLTVSNLLSACLLLRSFFELLTAGFSSILSSAIAFTLLRFSFLVGAADLDVDALSFFPAATSFSASTGSLLSFSPFSLSVIDG